MRGPSGGETLLEFITFSGLKIGMNFDLLRTWLAPVCNCRTVVGLSVTLIFLTVRVLEQIEGEAIEVNDGMGVGGLTAGRLEAAHS